MNIDQQYDNIIRIELQKRLNRQPKQSEVDNSDFDNDLVSETLWQLIKELDTRIKVLEGGKTK